jgi:hypothetical protein
LSTNNPFVLDLSGYLKFITAWVKGDAYWIVKLAFHPEMAGLFKKNKAHGGKYGAA